MIDSREDRIRHRAHALWVAAGQPDGAHEAHWQQAETEVDTADAVPVAPKPARKPRAAAAPKPAKAAAKPRVKKA